MPEPFDIQRVDVQCILDLRHRVLRAGLPADTARFDGDDEPQTIHLAATNPADPSQVLGCLSLMPRPYQDQPAWQLRGMAVDTTAQRRGIGAALLAYIARHGPHGLIWANARVPAVPFYEKHGWVAVSDVFEIPTAGPHRVVLWPTDRRRPVSA